MIGEKISCGLDIGSKKIKACLVKTGRGNYSELLGVHESVTRGLKDTSILDLAELSECINHTINNIVKRTGFRIKDVHLGIGGHLVNARYSHAVIPLIDKGNKVITTRDINRINRHARLLGVKMEDGVLHEYPQQYTIDDHNTALNPFGLYGRKLEVHFLLVLAHNTFLANITKVVNHAGYEIKRISFSSLLSAEVSVNKTAKLKGCAFIDIGASATNILFLKDGVVREIRILPYGGNDITQGISQRLKLAFDLAEDIKKSYAVVVSDAVQRGGEILIKRKARYVPIKREDISESIEPEVERLVHGIKDTVYSSVVNDQLNDGIIISGGGSLLPGLIERIESSLNLPIKMGKVNISEIGGNNSAVVAACIGLAKHPFQKSSNNLFPSRNISSPASRFTTRLKELYQEYF